MKIKLLKIIKWFLDLIFLPKSFVLPSEIKGSEELIIPKIDLASGDWTPYLSSPFESQWLSGFDSHACVVFSGIHTIEAMMNYYIREKLWPDILIKAMKDLGYLNEEGWVDISERFSSKMSGLKKNGVSMADFWASVNRDGVLPQKWWPQLKGNYTWEEWMAEIPKPIKDFAKQTTKLFTFPWKFIVLGNCKQADLALLMDALKRSPLHFAGPSCSRNAAGVQVPCGSCASQHARLIYKIDDYFEIENQYAPFLNKAALDMPMPWIVKSSIKVM
jgi:hypothetical protein